MISNKKNVFFATIIVVALLLGCDGQSRVEASPSSGVTVNINALPIIMNVVAGVVPELNLNNGDAVLNRICRVAYGEVKPSAFRGEINQSEISKEKGGALVRLVQSDNVETYQAVCAAYMIQSAASIPDVNQYVVQKKNANGQPLIEANEEAVINLMPFRLAVARATAELYARIAVSLPEKKVQPVEIYNQKIHRLFAQSAAGYLETVRKYNIEEMKHRYQLLLLQKGKFSFKSATGYVLDINSEGVSLYLYGAPWLANGHILGVIHDVEITLE